MIGDLSLYSTFSLTWPAAMKQKKIGSLGTKENFYMATVLLFWNTNIVDMTSCENVLLAGESEVAGDWGDWVSDASTCIMGLL